MAIAAHFGTLLSASHRALCNTYQRDGESQDEEQEQSLEKEASHTLNDSDHKTGCRPTDEGRLHISQPRLVGLAAFGSHRQPSL